MSRPLSRRLAVRLGAGTVGVLLVGCEDSAPSGRSSPGASSRTGAASPTRDPAELAALRVVAGNLQTLVARYDAVSRRHPALRTRLAAPRKLHTVQLTRLRELGGVPGASKPTTKPVPAAAAAAIGELAATEQRLSVNHVTAAAQRSGQAARLLAMIAASQTQVAVALRRRSG